MNKVLYHGGAPGFRPGDVIEPHETRHIDDCEICRAQADENHKPGTVFASPVRIYAKFYASKYVKGWLYIVEPIGEFQPSDGDPFESYYGPALRVLSVSERAVVLTMSERRRLWRAWTEADKARGIGERNISAAWAYERLIGIRR